MTETNGILKLKAIDVGVWLGRGLVSILCVLSLMVYRQLEDTSKRTEDLRGAQVLQAERIARLEAAITNMMDVRTVVETYNRDMRSEVAKLSSNITQLTIELKVHTESQAARDKTGDQGDKGP